MNRCIIIRGAAGVGKTEVAKKLASILHAQYISYDKIMKKHHLDKVARDGIPTKNFIQANKLIFPLAKQRDAVVLDGCFYRKKQISHLLKLFPLKIIVFTLYAPLSVCMRRNLKRKNPMTRKDIGQVYSLVSKVKIGKIINTAGKNTSQIVSEIISYLKN